MKSTGSEYDEKTRWPLESDSKPSRRHTGPVETETELADEPPLEEGPGDDPGPEGSPERAGEEEQHDDGDES
jgi:hypothetical protein